MECIYRTDSENGCIFNITSYVTTYLGYVGIACWMFNAKTDNRIFEMEWFFGSLYSSVLLACEWTSPIKLFLVVARRANFSTNCKYFDEHFRYFSYILGWEEIKKETRALKLTWKRRKQKRRKIVKDLMEQIVDIHLIHSMRSTFAFRIVCSRKSVIYIEIVWLYFHPFRSLFANICTFALFCVV